MTKRVAGWALAAALVLSASGGSSNSSAPTTLAPATSTPADGAAAGSSTTVAPVVVPTSVPNNEVKRQLVTITSCAAVAGGWSASGTAANPGRTTASYAITIFFTTAYNTVLDFATASVSVAPGKTAKWVASKKFSAVTQLVCVLRGVA
jgi:hypothetical protein